jgi:hypothetical protein
MSSQEFPQRLQALCHPTVGFNLRRILTFAQPKRDVYLKLQYPVVVSNSGSRFADRLVVIVERVRTRL